MKNIVEKYMDWLSQIAGIEDEIISIENQSPQIFVSFYNNLPDKGCKTAYSFGLSSANNTAWTNSRPELVISTSDSDNSWGLAMGEIIKQYRYEKNFSYGDVFNFCEPISDNSDMSCFLIYANSLYEPGDDIVDLDDRVIQLCQLYPIYHDEMKTISKKGVKYFISQGIKVGIDMFDINRNIVS